MRLVIGVSVCLLTAGCIQADVRRLDQAVRPARSPDEVTVLQAEPQQPYAVIAVVESRTDALFRSFDDLRQRMIAEAAQLGGDALIVGPESTKSTFILVPPAMIRSDQKRLTGKIIVLERGP